MSLAAAREVRVASPTASFAASAHANPGRAIFLRSVRPYNRPMEPIAAESPATLQAELAELRAKLAESHALLAELRERDSHLRMAMQASHVVAYQWDIRSDRVRRMRGSI